MIKKIIKTKEEWKRVMTPLQYEVMVEKGTEPAFNNAYDKFMGKGVYYCAACGLPLFRSEAKYDSGTGWPSFFEPISPENVIPVPVSDFFEVKCARCELHLGHIFDDGPAPASTREDVSSTRGWPTGQRYCLNSVCLNFKPE
jgi:peptide-methionine (R)-S-oxide reductase